MPRVTLRTSTIFISEGAKTSVYRSVSDVPPRLRKKLQSSTSGSQSATILIADRNGREEILRAIRGLPSELRPRLQTSGESSKRSPQHWTGILSRNWAEILLPGAIGLILWLLYSTR